MCIRFSNRVQVTFNRVHMVFNRVQKELEIQEILIRLCICSKTSDVPPLICTLVTCKLSICTSATASVQIDSLQVTPVQISGWTSSVFEQILPIL